MGSGEGVKRGGGVKLSIITCACPIAGGGGGVCSLCC